VPLITIAARPRHLTTFEVAQGIVGFFYALREHLVRERALADGYTRGRSDGLDELFWRFVSSGDVDYDVKKVS
jgi:hypothetical protein